MPDLAASISRFGLVSALLVSGALMVVPSSPAGAAQCGPYAALIDQLKSKFQEQRQATGFIAEQAMMELFIAESGTWTVVVTMTTGMACVVAAGSNWDGSVKLVGPAT